MQFNLIKDVPLKPVHLLARKDKSCLCNKKIVKNKKTYNTHK